MRRLPFIYFLLLSLTFTFTECKKNNDTQPQNSSSSNNNGSENNNGIAYNKADTTINLQKGRLTIAIPAGAMEKGTKISMETAHEDFIDTANLLHQFELKPAGTTFKKPVTMTFHYDHDWLKGHSPWDIGIAYLNEQDGKWYPAVNGKVDTVKQTISIKTKHFSHWTMYNCFHLYMQANGQFSEDNAFTIEMKPGQTGYVLLDMVEPPAWKNDPDKDREFSNRSLVAPLVPQKISPNEKYQKALKPDEWRVNNIHNGNSTVGTISLIGGESGGLYRYQAPDKVPGNGDVNIVGQIDYAQSPAILLLFQGVKILGGKWKLDIADSIDATGSGAEFVYGYHYSVNFHINKKGQIVYDGEQHHNLEFYKIVVPDATMKITSDDYTKVSNITGDYNEKTNRLNIQLNIGFNNGTVTVTECNSDGCVTHSGDGSGYKPLVGDVHLKMKAVNGHTFRKDSTMAVEDGQVHFSETYRLENLKK